MKFFKLEDTIGENDTDDNIRIGAKNISRIVLIITYVTILGIIIGSIYQLKTNNYENNIVGWIIGAFFVVIAVPLTIYDIIMHIANYFKPQLQLHCIRILFMVPVYSLNSWFALYFSEQKVYFETLRESYEAYVIYSFFHLMLNYLGEADSSTPTEIPNVPTELNMRKESTESKSSNESNSTEIKHNHLFPFNFIFSSMTQKNLISKTSIGVLQYLIIRLIITIGSLIIYVVNPIFYGYEKFGNKNVYSLFMIIICLSQAYAVYCVVLFCKTMQDKLTGIRPLSKFLIIKFIIFLTFWQSVIIPFCNYIDAVQSVLLYSQDTDGIKNLLICIEMAFAGVGHHMYYNYNQFSNASDDILTKQKKKNAIIESVFPNDIIIDIKRTFRQ